MTDILDEYHRLIDSGPLSCVDRFDLPARQARTVAIPDSYRQGVSGRWLMNDDALQGCVWLHQQKAMETVEQGHNVVVSTGTASGKSLIFQSATFKILDQTADAVAIVFYPLRALAADQMESWQTAASFAEMNVDNIVKIDGSVPKADRVDLLSRARVVLMTPDICHAWLLRDISNPAHRDFLARTSIAIIDESHVLEGILGSNFAYLFRRLCAARDLSRPKIRPQPLQVIATSATILKPEQHLRDLTGLEFETIGESDNGSPHHTRSIIHLAPLEDTEREIAAEFLKQLVDESDAGSFLAFVDSRMGTERMAIDIDRDDLVKPYRAGYEVDDRKIIENTLRSGHLRGVVSTSALELGIDIPHFSVGINVAVPLTRKSFRQRLGRIGRRGPGSFGIVADPYAFKRFGTTLREYYGMSVEPSYLYLQNRFIQYAHARCLAEELEMLGVTRRKVPPSTVSWPKGFADIFDFAYAGGPAARPREFDRVYDIGGDQPHHNYPLRNAPEEAFNVVHGGHGPVTITSRLGRPNLQQAIREAFPGATYLYMARGYRVHEWKNSPFDGRTIRVSPTKSPMIRKPIIRTFVNCGIDSDGIVDGHFRKAQAGFLAECQLQIMERVEGYKEGSKRNLYKDLRQSKPGMTPKTRDFRTTGVVIQIDEGWFQEKHVKRNLADVLRELVLREYSIAPQDVDAAATNISLVRNGQLVPISSAIVLFDSTHGTLRLTESIYNTFGHLLDRLDQSADMISPEENLLSSDTRLNLRRWFEQIGEAEEVEPRNFASPVPGGWLQVFAVGSIVAVRDRRGVLRDVEITGYQVVEIGDAPQLLYSYKIDGDGRAMISAEKVEGVGDSWRKIYWNPATDDTREVLDDDD